MKNKNVNYYLFSSTSTHYVENDHNSNQRKCSFVDLQQKSNQQHFFNTQTITIFWKKVYITNLEKI